MKILALCGSLRAHSYSLALLRAMERQTPVGVEFHIFDRHGELPLFNPECESSAPESVQQLWREVAAADAMVIASPEYAHGVTAVMKNTLEWLVGFPPFAYKPVAVFNPAMQSHHADASLKEILRTMSADLIAGACLRIPVIGSGVDMESILDRNEFSSALAAIMDHVKTVGLVDDLRPIVSSTKKRGVG